MVPIRRGHQILDLLERSGAHASFFVIGENAKRWPSLVEREAQDGDTIGDHTWSHPNLTAVSSTAVYVELGRDRNLITTLSGNSPTLWRPPYEAFNPSVIGIASGLGMKMQLWSVDTGDWQLPGTELIVFGVMAALHNGMVVLLHDGGGYTRSETVNAVAILIPELEAAGYRLRHCRLREPALSAANVAYLSCDGRSQAGVPAIGFGNPSLEQCTLVGESGLEHPSVFSLERHKPSRAPARMSLISHPTPPVQPNAGAQR